MAFAESLAFGCLMSKFSPNHNPGLRGLPQGEQLCFVLFYFILFCFVLSCLVLSCLVLPCLALSCLVLLCFVLPCLALSCFVLFCLVLFYFTLIDFALIWLVLFKFYDFQFYLNRMTLCCSNLLFCHRFIMFSIDSTWLYLLPSNFPCFFSTNMSSLISFYLNLFISSDHYTIYLYLLGRKTHFRNGSRCRIF